VANPDWGTQADADRLGYDGAGRTITKRYVNSTLNGTTKAYNNATAVVGFTAAYDLASNKRYERHLHAESRSHLYPSLDSLDRLKKYQRGTLELDPGGRTVTVSSAINLAGTDTQRSYQLDGLGNWERTVHTPVSGNETTEVREHNKANQVTKFGSTDVQYDNGAPYARAVLGLDPVGYWRLGEKSGAWAADQTGDNDGAYTPFLIEWDGGSLDQTGALANDTDTAALFNGTDGCVTAYNGASLQIEGNITLMAWVKVATYPGSGNYGTIVGKGYDGTNTAYWLAIKEDSDKHYLIAGAGESATPEIVSWEIDKTAWPIDLWVHVAAVFDGSYWRLFFNGQPLEPAASEVDPVDTDNPLWIGAFDNQRSARRLKISWAARR